MPDEMTNLAATYREIAIDATRDSGWIKKTLAAVEKAAKKGQFTVTVPCTKSIYDDAVHAKRFDDRGVGEEVRYLLDSGFSILWYDWKYAFFTSKRLYSVTIAW